MRHPSLHKTFVQRRPNVFDVGPTLYKMLYKCFCVYWDQADLVLSCFISVHYLLIPPQPWSRGWLLEYPRGFRSYTCYNYMCLRHSDSPPVLSLTLISPTFNPLSPVLSVRFICFVTSEITWVSDMNPLSSPEALVDHVAYYEWNFSNWKCFLSSAPLTFWAVVTLYFHDNNIF